MFYYYLDAKTVQKIVKQKIVINRLKKIKAEEKTNEYKLIYSNELEKKSYN